MQGFLFPSDGWKISIRWSQHDGLAVNHTASWWWICAFFNIYTPSKILAKNKKEYRWESKKTWKSWKYYINYVKTIKNIKALAVCWLSGWYCFTKKVLCVLIPILFVRNVRVGTGFLPHPRHLIPVMIECLCVVYVTDIQSPQGVSPPFAQSSGSGKALAPAWLWIGINWFYICR